MDAEIIGKTRIVAPWYEYAEKVRALFAADGEVRVEFDAAALRLEVRVESQRKAAALERLLPPAAEFGGVTVDVAVIPGNKVGPLLPDDAPPADVVDAAFRGNAAVRQIRQVSKGLFRDFVYVVFRKEVVQYPADNLGDVNGNRSTLMEDIARDVLRRADGAFFCTSAVGGLVGEAADKPLGVWP